MDVMKFRRHMPPGIYNSKRLKERPIPDTELDVSSESEISDQQIDDELDDEADHEVVDVEEIPIPNDFMSDLVQSMAEEDDPLDTNQ